MDADRLDTIARTLAERGPRRLLLRWLPGAALGLAIWHREEEADPVAAKNCKKIKNKRKRKKCKQKTKKSTSSVLLYQCPGPVTGTFTNFSDTRFAQVFTAARSGSLHQIQFDVIKDAGSAGDYVVQLLAVGADGKPNNTVLAHAIVPNDAVPDGATTLTASFSGPPLVAGQAYASAISRPPGSEIDLPATPGDNCAGTGFLQSPIETGAFVPMGVEAADLITSVTVLA
jgi:hypothetical protein